MEFWWAARWSAGARALRDASLRVCLLTADETRVSGARSMSSRRSSSVRAALLRAGELRAPTHRLAPGREAGDGWTPLEPSAGGANLDFIRGNLFDRAAMRPLPPDAAGPDNDLADLLDHYVERAIADPTARVYAFGERWGPEGGTPDKVFGFPPGNGVHDIHMNQGNSAALPRRRRRMAGRRAAAALPRRGALGRDLPGLPEPGVAHRRHHRPRHRRPAPRRRRPDSASASSPRSSTRWGPRPSTRRVVLLNASPETVDLTGWRLADRTNDAPASPQRSIAAGEPRVIALPPDATAR